MAEYLKNKPIALRHCLLYVFLQESSAEKAFTELCEVIGKDAITEEELEFWFDKFKNGLFDIEKDKKPITDMKDILRSDKKALRVCIFYESLKFKYPEFKKNDEFIRHPMFSVYMHFCKVIGENVMEYREFDFWFYRFANGVFDLKFEKDEKHKIYELTDMPVDIMKNIVEYLDMFERLSLEKTSKSLRLFSQNQKVFHRGLTFRAGLDSSYISFGVWDEIKYKNEGDDCEVEFRNSKKVLRGVSSKKQAFQDFKKILENRKLYLHFLIISFSFFPKDINSLEEHIENALQFTHVLHVQHLSLHSKSMKALLHILSSLKPGYLNTITINNDLYEATIGELVEMDQWKQAKYLNMSSYLFDGPLHHLYHFHEFTAKRQEFFIDDVREMKEVLLKSPDFEKCNLVFRKIDDRFSIMQEFGGPIEGSIDTCHYPIPNSTDYFEILVRYSIVKVERKKK